MNKVSDELRDKRRQETASRIAAQMRKGTAVWQQSNSQAADKNFVQPYNPVSGYKINGYNMIELFSHKEDQEKIGPEVFTFSEAKKENWYIKKGAKSITLENYLKLDMGFEKVTDKETGKTKDQFYKRPADKPILYNYPVFTLNDLQNEHEIKTNSIDLNTSKSIQNLIDNTGIKIVPERGLKQSFYAPKRDEIHVKEDESGEINYDNKILHNIVRASGMTGRAFPNKDIEGFSAQHNDLSYVKNKFRIEIATMQTAMRTGLPYEPSMTEFENKQIAGLIEKNPLNLVIMANEASRMANYVISNTKDRSKEKTLDDFINAAVKEGKISDRQISDNARKLKFPELEGKSDIKKRHIINEKLKQSKANIKTLSR